MEKKQSTEAAVREIRRSARREPSTREQISPRPREGFFVYGWAPDLGLAVPIARRGFRPSLEPDRAGSRRDSHPKSLRNRAHTMT